jgi:hypothetical protein
MKKIFIIVILFFTNSLVAQSFSISFAKKEYFNSIVKLENGDEIKGYLKDFTLPDVIEFQGFGYDFKDIEKQLKLNKIKFKFKTTLESEIQEYDLDQVKNVKIVTEGDTLTWEKIKLRKISRSNEVEDLDYSVMVPVLENSKIKVYGYKVYESSTKTLMWFLTYIKNVNHEYGYIPMDFNEINLTSNSKDQLNMFYKAFELAGNDCPAYVTKLNQLKEEDPFFKDGKKQMSDEAIKMFSELEDEAKKIKDKKARQKFKDNGFFKIMLTPYIKLSELYDEECP